MPVNKNRRDLNIELLRCVLMVGVCVVHSIFAGVTHRDVLSMQTIISGLVHCSVDGFVLISGYYGIRFSWAKLSKLYAVALFYSCLTGDPVLVLHGFWFLHAYAVLMVLSPLLKIEKDLKLSLPFLILIFGYGWLANLAHIKDVDLPLRMSFDSHTWTTLIGMYVLGRLYRIYEWDRLLSIRVCLICICLLSVINGLQFGYFSAYNGPFCAGLAICVFTIFKKLNIDTERFPKLSIMLRLAGPSLFPVYIIHQTPVGRQLVNQIGAYRVNLPGETGGIYGVLLGLSVFFLCFAIDSIRRAILVGIRKLVAMVR